MRPCRRGEMSPTWPPRTRRDGACRKPASTRPSTSKDLNRRPRRPGSASSAPRRRRCGPRADVVLVMVSDDHALLDVLAAAAPRPTWTLFVDMGARRLRRPHRRGRLHATGHVASTSRERTVGPARRGELLGFAGGSAGDLSSRAPCSIACVDASSTRAASDKAKRSGRRTAGAHHWSRLSITRARRTRRCIARSTVDAFTDGAFASPSYVGKKPRVPRARYDAPDFRRASPRRTRASRRLATEANSRSRSRPWRARSTAAWTPGQRGRPLCAGSLPALNALLSRSARRRWRRAGLQIGDELNADGLARTTSPPASATTPPRRRSSLRARATPPGSPRPARTSRASARGTLVSRAASSRTDRSRRAIDRCRAHAGGAQCAEVRQAVAQVAPVVAQMREGARFAGLRFARTGSSRARRRTAPRTPCSARSSPGACPSRRGTRRPRALLRDVHVEPGDAAPRARRAGTASGERGTECGASHGHVGAVCTLHAKHRRRGIVGVESQKRRWFFGGRPGPAVVRDAGRDPSPRRARPRSRPRRGRSAARTASRPAGAA